ncbi:FlxA-like family protein (plasmid) [Acaryochloris sp. 'Moss Beach']|uniref:DUF6399 domain-containing protein n=1 Tax=Acaryochloris sp. 'Moss Beach' TaxID=2740837 RepID=UPI001F3A3AF7|nr:DUF6399 domain-containing protein [Acaryochloris sp. 'Moss Beach']UJB71374.1 FlxA-like family protein [Acaryochloris sp. 'Moss Beach']UJB72414.1 FlxA-like family protein [Acaryochloris sp. 'Moss Beach']
MSLTIRERCQAVTDCLFEQGVKGIAKIAAATGLSKSSVHRHQQAIARRNQYPESLWWETQTGSQWLRVMVLGVVYYFGIKHGVGAESLSEFFTAIHIDAHVGVSASSLRLLKRKMRDAIIAYDVAQQEHCQPTEGQGICVGGDETFFGLPILVMLELASGFIFTEVERPNRTYATWQAQIQQWWTRCGWHCHFMVSDGAPALIKLAVSGLGCVSVSDLFHALSALAQPIGSDMGRQISQLNKKATVLQQQLLNVRSEAKQQQLQQSIAEISAQQQSLEQDKTAYHQVLHRLTQVIHPFNIKTLEWQLFDDLSAELKAPLAQMSALAKTYGAQKGSKAIDSFQQQIPSMAQGIHAWWLWVTQALKGVTDDLDVQNWVLMCLLPWAYWQQQTDKTRNPLLKADYRKATEQAYDQLLKHPITQQMDSQKSQEWVDWAQWMSTKYQRTSSAVEGRNGYLSRLHHAARGFSEESLKVLTIIHNFDLKRADGTTAAQRLFGHPFPDVFESVISSMGELPVARQSSKTKRPNPLTQAIFPA